MPPTALINALESLRRKARLLGVTFGIGVLLAATVSALLVTILLDYALNLPAGPRFVLVLSVVGIIGFVLARYVIHPLTSRISLSDIAGKLERVFPHFDDRVRSTVNFMTGRIDGSEAMKDQVVGEATRMVMGVDLNRALVTRPVWYSSAAGLGAILLVALLATVVVNPLYTRVALTRLLMPFAGATWPKRVNIEMTRALIPQRVPAGQRIGLFMRLAKGDRASMKALVNYQLDDGKVQQEYMTRDSVGIYSASLDARTEGGKTVGHLKVWITAGDDRKDIPTISILPRLAITSVEADVTPPRYVAGDGGKTATFNLARGPAVMAAGSQLAVRVGFNKPLAKNEKVEIQPIAVEMKAPPVAWDFSGDNTVVGKFLAEQSVRFHITATDTDGFTNSGLEEYEVIVRPDQSPTVQIENPRRNEERTPEATVPLQAVAEDDYGIKSLKLVIDRLGDKKHWEVDLVDDAKPVSGVSWSKIDGSGERLRYRANFAWELSKLKDANLKSGDVLEYFLRVADNYELNGTTHAPAASGRLRINIISQEQLTDLITIELRQIANQVNDVRNNQNRTKEETATLGKETAEKEKFEPADRAAAERLANQQSTAASQAKQVAGKLEAVQQRLTENKSPAKELADLSADVKKLLENAAENPMKQAAGEINKAADEKKDERNKTMASANANQQRASEQLQQALDRMGNIGSLQQTIDKFRDILAKQQELTKQTAEIGNKNIGKKPDEMNPEDRKALEDAAAKQDQLSKQTDKALAEMNKTADQMAKTDPASAQAMKQAAQTGQQQQVSPNQSKAAKAAKQNQQSSAQANQKAAELGLQMIINDLREAERRKLEELSKKLEELQQQVTILIRRQAGHNLDNLTMQGPERVAKVEAKILEELLTAAQRTKENPGVNPQLPTLTAGQEQTERNTRDIAKSAEEIPNGTEAAANLTRAAGKMERAIVSLRAKNLPEAYEPPQVEALAALLDAKKVIDQQKQEVDQKREDQQKEAVRQAYIKIKEEQEKLNVETTRLDKAPRGEGGALVRADAVRLGQLPGEQGKLSDRTSKLEESLAAVGSIVYVWANKDIVTTMNEVKDDLAKPATSQPTQTEQARIVEQLDAMIRNLAIKPPDQKFEKRDQGGGGGGAGQPKVQLPPEAELRLLKELQQAINKSTKTLDARPDKDKPKLLALGGRQGEIRGVLDELLKKVTGGQTKLGPEPDNRDQLPEEATKEQVEDQELEQDLLKGNPDAEAVEKEMNRVGDRMARSRQRLALNTDPGKTTQEIQKRIVMDLDKLIDQARQQQQQAQSSPKPGDQPGPPKPSDAKAQNDGQSKPNKAATPAANDTMPGHAATNTDISQQIKESASEWGKISPRARDAVVEGQSEQIVEKYRKFVEDYYRGVATSGTQR